MGKFEIIGIAVFAVIGLLFFVAESESIPEKLKRYLALSTILLFVGGTVSLFLVDDKLGDWSKPVDEAEMKKKKKVTALANGKGEMEEMEADIVEVSDAQGEGDALNPDDLPTIRDCDFCPSMVVLPPGTFIMGAAPEDPDNRKAETPQRAVKITRSFAIGQYEVLRQEFDAFIKDSKYVPAQSCLIKQAETPSRNYANPGFKQDGLHPVTCVTLKDAEAYLAWLSRKTAQKYRLLSEAEWEYAARARTKTPYATGASIGQAAIWGSTDGTRRAGTFPRNKFALFDMNGNIAEFVEDCWHEGFRGAPYDGRPWVDKTGCQMRVAKGGSWYDDAAALRSAARQPFSAALADYGIGFRAAREVE